MPTLFAAFSGEMAMFIIGAIIFVLVGFFVLALRFYRKVDRGSAIVRTGGPKRVCVSFDGIFVIPIVHHMELMDISVKRIEIFRHGSEGLVCKDNMRADIKVAFFVRVNQEKDDVLKVAQQLGCERASEQASLVELFDARFSEALKTVGKQFDFIDLYTEREKFRDEIIHQIGDDLNGYKLEGANIDYLEQTPKDQLDPNNILDAEGIKKITDLTAVQSITTNGIERDKQKTIRKQDVEAREAILELDRQQAEAEETQAREIAAITARERAEAEKIRQEQKLKAENARIATEEELAVREENRMRQIIVAQRNKERTDKVEQERVEKERELEHAERLKLVGVAEIEKDKVVEEEKKLLQEVIRDRVAAERLVVEEKQNILDTEQFKTADRSKQVQITKAEEEAEMALIIEVRAAEADKQAATRLAEMKVIEAEATRDAAERETQAKKMLAEATVAETAAPGLGEAKIQEARAVSLEKEGTAEAVVMQRKFDAEADGITRKAEAMKLFHDAGKEHEEFKLQLNKDKSIELAAIDVQKDIASEQSKIVGEALKQANIDIVGGDSEFFDRIVNSVTGGKVVDRYIKNSEVLSDVKETFFNGDGDYFEDQFGKFVGKFNLDTGDVKNLSIAALITKMMASTDNPGDRSELELLLEMAKKSGLAGKKASSLAKKAGKKN